jgi:DNA-binding TFAR19-related protein (PDSD5 family)
VARILRRRALKRLKKLIAKHGNATSALNDIYLQRRGKAAHADNFTVEFDALGEVPEQIQDAELIKYMARVAIEQHWK